MWSRYLVLDICRYRYFSDAGAVLQASALILFSSLLLILYDAIRNPSLLASICTHTVFMHVCLNRQLELSHKVIKAINPVHRKDHALKTNIPLCHIDCQYILNFKLLDGQTTSAIYSIKKKKITYHINLNGTDLNTIQYMSNMKLGSLHPSPSKIQRAASSNQQRVNTLTLVASTSQKFSNVIFETKEMCNMCKHSHYQKTMCISNPYKLSTFWQLVSSFPPRGLKLSVFYIVFFFFKNVW